MTTKGKVLVLVSSGRGLPLKDGKVYSGAGYYLNELTVPVRALMNEGYEITFATPKGNTPQVDVHSEVADFFGGDAAKLQDYMLFRDGLTGLRDPSRISDVIASGLDQYDAVFVPGGHGPMIDLLDDPDAGTVLETLPSHIQAYSATLPRPDYTSLSSSKFEGVRRSACCGRHRWSEGKSSRLDLFWIQNDHLFDGGRTAARAA